MARVLRACVLLLIAASGYAALPFAHEASDLKPDPAAHFGTLPNGVRYVVLAHGATPGRAALRLLVLAGSAMETERQRGVAHLLEHLSMDGSTHFPPGVYKEHFQRLGMAFGPDANAFTSDDRTVYVLNVTSTA